MCEKASWSLRHSAAVRDIALQAAEHTEVVLFNAGLGKGLDFCCLLVLLGSRKGVTWSTQSSQGNGASNLFEFSYKKQKINGNMRETLHALFTLNPDMIIHFFVESQGIVVSQLRLCNTWSLNMSCVIWMQQHGGLNGVMQTVLRSVSVLLQSVMHFKIGKCFKSMDFFFLVLGCFLIKHFVTKSRCRW